MQMPCLRKFPYPYRAAIALGNDIDNTPSLDVFIEMMKFLNTTNNTIFGRGIGIEVGSSFWFFNLTQSSQLSYFKNGTLNETDFAPICRELWHSGHLDCLHTYGDFDEGGFERKYAEVSCNELIKSSAKIQTWINHGNRNNIQNLGLFDYYFGDDPHHCAYHFDLLANLNLRYIWSGKMTHVLGQDASRTTNVMLKMVLQEFLAATKYRTLTNKPYYVDNELMRKVFLRDGHSVWDFQRFVNNWGREQILDSKDLCSQIGPKNISRLICNGGFLIVYTHMFEGLDISKPFPASLYNAFKYIAERYYETELLVSTTSRLLEYYELIMNIKWTSNREGNYQLIKIDPKINSLYSTDIITETDLQGITFYCEDPANVSVFLGDKMISVLQNDKDCFGKPSVSIPWKRLSFPDI